MKTKILFLRASILILIFFAFALAPDVPAGINFSFFDASAVAAAANFPFLNQNLSFQDRAADLVSRMTLSEKAAQMNNEAPGIGRLGLPGYSYGREAIHGWMFPYQYTVFPVPMAMGATWDPDIVNQVGNAISDEARGNRNFLSSGEFLNAWAPNINLARDPRWGRTEETYSEDPYLLSKFAVAYVTGMEGDNAKCLKTSTTLKHFAANNYEAERFTGSSNVDQRSLYEYYFPAFRAGVVEGHSRSVMNSYNAINGVPDNVNPWLLQDVLRGDWGFGGFVNSDCGDITGTVTGHHYMSSLEGATALSVKSGCDNDCGSGEYQAYLPDAAQDKLITEADVDMAARRVLETRVLLGDFDANKSTCYFNSIPQSEVNSQAHQALARQVEREAIVLLKNSNNLLPLSKSIGSIALIGPYSSDYYLGGYSNANPFYKISPMQGIKNKLPNLAINYSKGSNMDGSSTDAMINDAVDAAKKSKIAILMLGTDASFSGEGYDAANLNLPGRQTELAQKVYQANPNAIVVLNSGNPLSINWIAANIPAIVEGWHGGQEYGNALADVLFGDYNPAGRVAQTYYKDSNLLPPLSDYNIFNKRLYMYNDASNVLYPFGYGLSYTTFAYSNLRLSRASIKSYDTIQASVDVKNTGTAAGDEVVQLYIKRNGSSSVPMPKEALKGFKRLSINPGETKTVTFDLNGMAGDYYNVSQSRFVVDSGDFSVMVGASSTDIRQTAALHIDWSVPQFEGLYKIINKNSGLALETALGGQNYDGQNVVQGNYYGYNNQKWTIEQVDSQSYKIINLASGDVLDIRGASTANGALLQQWSYGGGANQQFVLTSLGGGNYSITAKQSGKSLDVQNSSVADGAAVQQWSYAGGANQQWQLVKANDNTAVALPPTWTDERKVFIGNGSNYLNAENNNFAIDANGNTNGASELFYLYTLADGSVALRAEFSGKYLGVDASGRVYADRKSVTDAERFYLVNSPNGATLKSKLSSRYLSVDNSGNYLFAGKDLAGATEFFNISDSTLSPQSKGWSATASNNPDKTTLAFDGDIGTRWDSGTVQTSGMWYKLDLENAFNIDGITLDSSNSKDDWPRGYTVKISNDDSNWTQVASAGPGNVTQNNGVVTITFAASFARYILITQTGSSPDKFWSIHEISVDFGCTPNKIDGCRICQSNASWLDDDSKCAQNKKCWNGKCIDTITVIPQTAVFVAIKANINDKYVCAENGGASSLIANRDAVGPWETYSMIPQSDGTVAFKSQSNGKYVTAESAGASALIANRDAVGPWEKFSVSDAGQGLVTLKSSADAKFVTAENAGASPLIANRDAVGPWEKFALISITGSAPSCQNQCSSGAKQCSGNGYQTCQDTNGDGCLEWSTVTTCAASQTCNNGECKSNTVCIPKICTSLNYACGTADDGCGNTLNCGTCASGQTCNNGVCIANQTCVPNSVSGCAACNSGGLAWIDTDSKCSGSKKCLNGKCADPITSMPQSTASVAIKANVNGRYVCAEGAGTGSLIANRDAVGPWETYDLLPQSDGTVVFQSKADNKYVTAENAGAASLIANRDAIGPWEKFFVSDAGQGFISLKSNINNKYVTAESAGVSSLIANRDAVGPWEKFALIPIAGSTLLCQNQCFDGAKQCSGNGYQTCGDVNGDGCLEWSNVAACASGQTCSNGECKSNPTVCIPKTCVVLDYYCGTADDGCGNTLNCGVCSSGQTCSSGACVSNSICIPKTCGQLGYDCSTGTDGCGNALNCGTCSNNQTCDNGICKTNGGGGGSGGTTPPPDQPIITKPVKQMTRAQILAAISQIQALIADLQKQLVALTGTATTNYSCTQITKNLFYGMANNPQVKCLQEVLKSQGYAVSGSGNYDAATKTAVVQFQQKYASEILAPYHLTRGSGNIGNATLAKLNAIISINSK